MIEEFKKFIMRGNVLDMAVGIIIGAAFGKIVSSFVSDILMPPLGLLIGKIDFCGSKVSRTAGYRLRIVPQRSHRLPHRVVRHLHAHQASQPSYACAACSESSASLPVLQDGDSRRGDTLPALHIEIR